MCVCDHINQSSRVHAVCVFKLGDYDIVVIKFSYHLFKYHYFQVKTIEKKYKSPDPPNYW